MTSTGLPFSPAVRLLAAAVSAGDRERAVRAVNLPAADWPDVLAGAERHGVTAPLAAVLHARTDAPPGVSAAVREALQMNAALGLQAVSELSRMMRALRQAGVAAAAMKGPALSQWLYGSPAFRRFADLDVLVTPADVTRAQQALAILGYRLPDGMSSATARAIFGGLGAWPLAGPGRFAVDLHWRLAHVRFPSPLDAAEVLRSAVLVEIGGDAVAVPSPTHTALLTLLHAAKHLWCTLDMVSAVAALMRRSDVDWLAVRHLALRARAWNGCATGLRLAAELLGAEVPSQLRAAPWPHATEFLRTEALSALQLPAGVFQDRWVERRAHRAAFDRPFDRLAYDAWRLLAPTPLEWAWCPLPDRLRWFYVPVRLARLGLAAARRAPGEEAPDLTDPRSSPGSSDCRDRARA